MKVRLISPANIELDEAVRFYNHQLPGLGFRFYQETEKAIERIRFIVTVRSKSDTRGDKRNRADKRGMDWCQPKG